MPTISEVRSQENAIILAAAEKLVSLGSDAAQLLVAGKEATTPTDNGRKILTLFSAYAKKAEMDSTEIDALLYCLRSLSEAETFPTTNPIVGQALNVQVLVNGGALQWFDEDISVGQGIEEVNFLGAAVAAVKAGNRLNITISGGGSSLLVKEAEVDVADVNFDFESTEQVLFTADAVIGSAKTWNFTNTTGAKKFDFTFTMSTLDAQTMPADVLMGDVRFDGTSWVPYDLGKYRASAVYDGTNWFLEISNSTYF